jgi:hypothetical protein
MQTQEARMDANGLAKGRVQVNRGMLLAGVISVSFGCLLVALGSLLGGTAFLTAARQWMRQLDRPPQQTARLRYHQLRDATTAGARAWQSWSPTAN